MTTHVVEVTDNERVATDIEVSFVLIAFNEAAHIARTIDSILAQDALAAYEIIVVDDGSTDRTSAIVGELAARHDEIRLLCHIVNAGRGAARATGVNAAQGRFIAMVDSDIVLPPHWWATCRVALDEFDVVGGTAVPDGDASYLHQRSGLTPKVVKGTTVVTGNNGAYRAEVLRDVTFDNRLTEGEDIAINHALIAAGYKLQCIEGLIVDHKEDKDLRRSIAWLYLSGIGATRMLVNFKRIRTPDLATAGWVAVVFVALTQWRRPARAVAIVVGFAASAATAHLAQRFELDPRHPERVARVLIDTVLISAYFVGRIVGLRILFRPRSGAER